MRFEWDEAKRAANLAMHGVDFAGVESFDFESAIVTTDDRDVYEEPREIALGLIGVRLPILIFTWRNDVVRVISLRKGNSREGKIHERITT